MSEAPCFYGFGHDRMKGKNGKERELGRNNTKGSERLKISEKWRQYITEAKTERLEVMRGLGKRK